MRLGRQRLHLLEVVVPAGDPPDRSLDLVVVAVARGQPAPHQLDRLLYVFAVPMVKYRLLVDNAYNLLFEILVFKRLRLLLCENAFAAIDECRQSLVQDAQKLDFQAANLTLPVFQLKLIGILNCERQKPRHTRLNTYFFRPQFRIRFDLRLYRLFCRFFYFLIQISFRLRFFLLYFHFAINIY